MKDLELVYQAVSKEQAEMELDNLELKWGEDYPIVIKSWRDNWSQYGTDLMREYMVNMMAETTCENGTAGDRNSA